MARPRLVSLRTSARRMVRALGVVFLLSCTRTPERSSSEEESLSATALLTEGDTRGYARAEHPRPFSFPADHGPHEAFRSEWWYFTGQLETRGPGARRFGYQLTIFRQALAPDAPARRSEWATRQVYMGHLAITDVEGGRFFAFERLSRGAVGLAGAQARPFRVWVEDWQMVGPADGASTFPVTLRAQAMTTDQANAGPVALVLRVSDGRGPILQGDAGLSRKGPELGNASHYYSWTRLPTQGTLTVGGQTFTVTGASWLDREWSTSALGPDLAGWDWLSLSLSDGRDLMVFRLRRKDGGSAPESVLTLIEPDGRTRVLDPTRYTLVPRGTWQSPHSGARYPSAFTLRVPEEELTLEVEPLQADQELRLSVRYWEGAVKARGALRGQPLTGRGYLEMTGYASAPR